MNSATTFATLAYSKAMQAAGFTQKQAEAMAEAQKNALDHLASTHDIATRTDLAKLKAELLAWMSGIAIAQTSLLVAVWAFIK